MSEIFSSVNLKNKITIASSLAIFAVLLVTIIGVITLSSVDGHKHKYDYTLSVNEKGEFELAGVCTVKNCESPFYSEKDVDVIIYSYQKPTCSAEGTKVFACMRDGVTVKLSVNVAKVAHSYEYERVDGNNGISISGTCQNDGCTDPEIYIDNIDKFELISVVAATCSTPRKEIYEYTVNGQTLTLETQVDEYIPHTLNGVSADSLANSEGKYTLDISGVSLAGGEKTACGATVGGKYVCEKCNQEIAVKVVLPGHSFVYNKDKVVAPTLEADGKAILCCENPVCTETMDELIPKVEVGVNTVLISSATELYREKVTYKYESLEYGFTFEKVYEVGNVLPHNYQYALVPDDTIIGVWNLEGICNQADCQQNRVFMANVPAVLIEDTTSCQGPGEQTWHYVNEELGIDITQGVIMLLPAPHKYEYNKNDADHPSLKFNGSIELYCTTEGCDHTVTVELPKVVIGENAIFDKETDIGGLVYKYTYETEYNCVVELNITIYHEEE